jgi:FHS family L-fucose permease-like MFS transporter
MKKTTGIFYSIIGLFFFWGFVAAGNDILIPIFKDHLHIKQWQSQFISFVFYVAYTIGSIIYLIASHYLKRDLLTKTGYSKGLSIGLFISFIGTLLFIPAANNASFYALITGLFIIGIGFSLQQTAANPMVIQAGDEAFGSQRLSLAGGINNIGTTIGPLLVSYAVFGNSQTARLSDLKYPYLVLGFLFLIIAILFFQSKNNIKAENDNTETASYFNNIKTIISQKQVWMAMLAIFLYVGVEVSTAANLAEFAKYKANINTGQVAPYISLYWASLMIGRWASASDIFAARQITKIILKIIFPFLAFALFYLILHVNKKHIPHIEYMFGYILILIALDFLSQGNAAKQLTYYAGAGIILILAGIFTSGEISVFNIVAVGLFCSTLWPCIFEIALKGKERNTGIISSLLILMIMGGGWISLLQALLAHPLGITMSYCTGVFCFLYLLWYGITSLKNQ